MIRNFHLHAIFLGLIFSLVQSSTAGQGKPLSPGRTGPGFEIISKRYFDGVRDDLLTGGVGVAGLRAPPPAFADPNKPTRDELRRHIMHNNFNALIPLSEHSGFGKTFGVMTGTGKYAGYEYLSLVRNSAGKTLATLLVQVPDGFNSGAVPCIVAAPSSGSRGLYGAIGVVGPWALNRACAIAYTDKGTGAGVYFIETGESYDVWGRLNRHSEQDTLFSVAASPGLSAYKKTYPHRLALKHAHSQTNVERYWPDFLLQAIRFAFQVINEHRPQGTHDFTPENTLVIATGTSNGGGAAIRAAEQDTEGLIDAVVAAQPNLNMPTAGPVRIEQAGEISKVRAWKLIEYATFINLYLPCAVLSDSLSASPFYPQVIPPLQPLLEARCQGLHRLGLLEATQLNAQIAEAMEHLHQAGVLPDTHGLDAALLIPRVWAAVSAVYISAYGRLAVDEHPCGISFAAVDTAGKPVKMNQEMRVKLGVISHGIAGNGGINMIADTVPNGPVEIYRSMADKRADLSLASALCWRQLLTTPRVQAGLKEIEVNANLHGKPTIIVHGRHDNLLHVNHSSRPYYALNQSTRRDKSRLHYYEIENAQHFDRLLNFPEVAARYVPLQPYLEQALTAMYRHLTQDEALPPSQIIRTHPAGFSTPTLPTLSPTPKDNSIRFAHDTLIIP